MSRTDMASWLDCCVRIGFDADRAAVWHGRLVTAYREPQRFYHTLQHVEECLDHLDRAPCARSALVEMALWFHDAVYDPKSSDNEERSAALAAAALKDGCVPGPTAAEAQRLILLTKTHQPGEGADDAILIDIDLAILGADESRFEEYERQIRREYSWVAEDVYRARRTAILKGFLARRHLYLTSAFRQRFEDRARANLTRLIGTLQ